MSTYTTASSFFLPSHFGAPFLTTISTTRYDSKGRQLGFEETEVQRLERLAFINASKSRSNSNSNSNSRAPSPSSSSSSGSSSPMRLISEPYGDPIELMANRLAEKFMLYTSSSSDSDSASSSSEDEMNLKVSPLSPSRVGVPARKSPSTTTTTTFQPGHRRKRSSLSAIPEED